MDRERYRINVMPDQALLEGFISTPPTAIFNIETGEFERTRPQKAGVVPASIVEMPSQELLEARVNKEAYFDTETGKFELTSKA